MAVRVEAFRVNEDAVVVSHVMSGARLVRDADGREVEIRLPNGVGKGDLVVVSATDKAGVVWRKTVPFAALYDAVRGLVGEGR